MQINNLTGQPTKDNRTTGRTTAIALHAISTAIQHPNIPIEIADHYGTSQANHYLYGKIIHIILTLDLKNITVSSEPDNKDAVTLYFDLWEEIPEILTHLPKDKKKSHIIINGELYKKVETDGKE